MTVKLLTEHHFDFRKLKVRLSLFMSKCYVVGNHMSWMNVHNRFIIIPEADCHSMCIDTYHDKSTNATSYQWEATPLPYVQASVSDNSSIRYRESLYPRHRESLELVRRVWLVSVSGSEGQAPDTQV